MPLEAKDGFWANYALYVALSLFGSAFSIVVAIGIGPMLIFPLFGLLLAATTITGLALPFFWYRRYRRMAMAVDGDDSELADYEAEREETAGFFRAHGGGLAGMALLGLLAWSTMAAILATVPLEKIVNMNRGFPYYLAMLTIVGVISIGLPLKWWLTHRRSMRISERPDEGMYEGEHEVELTGFGEDENAESAERAEATASARRYRGL